MADLAVLRKADLPPGTRVIVRAGDREIAVLNVGGQYFALRNRCPHQAGPVGEGGLFERVCAEALPNGRIREWIEDDGFILACPWHGWEFDLRDGACLWSREHHLRTYSVREDEEGNFVVSG